MIFADKLIDLRKKNGWSQEELAEQLGVTRQSVSKWEGAQSIPDLDKIIRLSELFGVTTDYLLKDKLGERPESLGFAAEPSSLPTVTMEEAAAFLEVKAESAGRIALGVMLCIFSPVCLILLIGIAELPWVTLSENVMISIGIILLLLFVAGSVAIFVISHGKTAPYEYLEKEIFETQYGVEGMVRARQQQYQETHTRGITLGVILCILSVVPLFVGILIDEDSQLLALTMPAILLVLVGIGVYCFVRVGVVWGSYQMLLQEGDYTPHRKEILRENTGVSLVYWSVITAAYLGYSFVTARWEISWVVWPVAGVLFPAVLAIANVFRKHS